ncbi:MAG: aldehyde ferredoxin oxidoreductase family protein [Candidatus Bathyarchaeia archaeon]
MFGYAGRILRADLSNNKIRYESLQEDFVKNFIGGTGFCTSILYNEVPPDTPALSPENKLVFAVGPLTGTIIPGSSRYVVASKSPLTGLWGEADCGGFWAPELKYAGFDAVVVEGCSKTPVYLWIYNGEAEIRDASHLWGMEVLETEKTLKKELRSWGDVQVVSIGPAGENLVKMAAIGTNHGHNWAARGGLGAVMGSKRLKAIVVRGDEGVEVADIDKLLEIKDLWMKEMPPEWIVYPNGTNVGEVAYYTRDVPFKNWGQDDWLLSSVTALGASAIVEKVRTKMSACFGCPLASKKTVKVASGPFTMEEGAGPEYETLAAFGLMCLNDNLESVCKANDICNRYGIDTIEAGTTIAFAMECYEKGLITKEDTDGIELTWGNAEAIVKMVEKIAKKEGFGKVLAEGVKNAAEKIGKGAEKYAMHVKGYSIVFHDPRMKPITALHYATEIIGGYHGKGVLGVTEGPIAITPSSIPEIAASAIYYQNMAETTDTLAVCQFLIFLGRVFKLYPDALLAATGIHFDLKELEKIGERIFNMKRFWITKLGINRKDDTLPRRFTEVPRKLEKQEYKAEVEPMLPEYYKLRGWNEQGIPTEAKLKELGIKPI